MAAIGTLLIVSWYWILPVVIAVGTYRAFHHRRCPLGNPSSCSVCGYSLDGLTTTVCPECGMDNSTATTAISTKIRSVRAGMTLGIGRFILALFVGALPLAAVYVVYPFPQAVSQWIVNSSWMFLLILIGPILISTPHSLAAVAIVSPISQPFRLLRTGVTALWTSIADGIIYFMIALTFG